MGRHSELISVKEGKLGLQALNSTGIILVSYLNRDKKLIPVGSVQEDGTVVIKEIVVLENNIPQGLRDDFSEKVLKQKKGIKKFLKLQNQ
jgi:hypothetical protein